MLRRLSLACATATCAIVLASCGGGSPSASPEAATHPAWVLVAEIVCPSRRQRVAGGRSICTTGGKPVEASFYDQAVDLDRRVSTFECTRGVKSVAGKDWMVPAVTDEEVVAKLLDAGGINLC